MPIVFDEIVAEIEPERHEEEREDTPEPPPPPAPRGDALRAELDLLARRAARLFAD